MDIDKIARDIKEVKIQGATNIAKAALKVYKTSKNDKTKKMLVGLRPTEPALRNALNYFERNGYTKTINHFDDAQIKINNFVLKVLNNGDKIYTHCHSTNVIKSLINAKKKGKKFEVFTSETRPLFQGRKTAKELSKAGIRVTSFVDSDMMGAVKEVDKIFLGADAITDKGIINKVGSGAIATLAKDFNKPVYIIADSWKYSPKNVKIEERDFHEVWKNAPKNIKIINPSFEFVDKKLIKKILSEKGILSHGEFLKKVN